jgi:hypothetical protein
VGNFCPPGSGSRETIESGSKPDPDTDPSRIRIVIQAGSGYGDTTLKPTLWHGLDDLGEIREDTLDLLLLALATVSLHQAAEENKGDKFKTSGPNLDRVGKKVPDALFLKMNCQIHVNANVPRGPSTNNGGNTSKFCPRPLV